MAQPRSLAGGGVGCNEVSDEDTSQDPEVVSSLNSRSSQRGEESTRERRIWERGSTAI